MRKGLGRVESVDGRLVWTFTAPHLGYWMAAPLTPPSGERRWNLLCGVDLLFLFYFIFKIQNPIKDIGLFCLCKAPSAVITTLLKKKSRLIRAKINDFLRKYFPISINLFLHPGFFSLDVPFDFLLHHWFLLLLLLGGLLTLILCLLLATVCYGR